MVIQKIQDYNFVKSVISNVSSEFLLNNEIFYPELILSIPRIDTGSKELMSKCFVLTNFRDLNYNWMHLQSELTEYLKTVNDITQKISLLRYIKLTPEMIEKYCNNKCFWSVVSSNAFIDYNFLSMHIRLLNFHRLRENKYIENDFNKYCRDYNYTHIWQAFIAFIAFID